MILNDIISALKKSDDIVILPHMSVDGDGLGSSIALGLALRKLGKKVKVFLEEKIPNIYNFLPGTDMVEVAGNNGSMPVMAEIAVALDTGDLERLGMRADLFKNSGTTVNIDHHNTNTGYAMLNFVQTSSSAVGEIVYQMVKMMGLDIDTDMSSCLYVAISTDTGGFRYSNTTHITHQIVSDLVSGGIDVAEISRKIFDTVSLEKVRLMGAAIDSLEMEQNGRIAFITIGSEAMTRTGASEEDCDGLVNIGRNIKGVEVAVLLRQWENSEVRVNLRSSSHVDVSKIASLYSGGGHKKAAGCTVKGDVPEVRQKLLQDISKEL